MLYKMIGVTVSAESGSGMVATIKMGDQQLQIDESGMESGENTGPSPNDYIMSALGACTVITLHMYASRKKWPLERAEVKLQSSTLPETEFSEGQLKDKRLLITKRLTLTGNLSPEQILRLKDISARCPVQRNLESGMVIQTILE